MPSEPTLAPSKLPSDAHEVIAVLESIHVPWVEPVDLGGGAPEKTYEALVYRNTVAGEDDVAARIRDASIVVCSTCRLTGETLGKAPYLKLIIGHAVGTDHIDLEYCRRNGIQVMNSTNCNSETVAEHAISLYFATRRSLVTIHNVLADFTPSRPNEWKSKGSLNARMRDAAGAPPRTCREEVAGIIGYGAVGKHIARLCKALGMRVLISERKDPSLPSSSSSPPGPQSPAPPLDTTTTPQRQPFPVVLRAATVLFLAIPLAPSTRHLLSAPELALLGPGAVVVNVSRGGVVDEAAVLRALSSRRLFGYGTDVFAVEPAGDAADSVLLGAARDGDGDGQKVNLILTAHLAWLSGTTIANQVRRVGENLRAWGDGEGRGDVVVLGTRK